MSNDNISTRSERRRHSTLNRRWAPGTPGPKPKQAEPVAPPAAPVDSDAGVLDGITVPDGEHLTLDQMRELVAKHEDLPGTTRVKGWAADGGRLTRLAVMQPEQVVMYVEDKPTTIVVHTAPAPGLPGDLTASLQASLARQQASRPHR